MHIDHILEKFKTLENNSLKKAYSKFGFSKVYGLKVSDLRNIAKEIGINKNLSYQLSEMDSYETVFLSILIADDKTIEKR